MKKIITFLTATSLLCCSVPNVPLSINALEAATFNEYTQQRNQLNENEFPDPDAKYSEFTENDLVYHMYDEYAVLAHCENSDLTEAVIPNEVQGLPVLGSIGSPFEDCRKLTTISLPDNFQHFKWYELTDTMWVKLGSDENPMPSVSEIIVSDDNPYYTVSEGLLYTKDMKTLVGCPPAMGMKELKINEQTERIGDYAFFACMELEKAVIPSHITHINNNAFTSCINLKSAELPESITSISGDMFFYCKSLTDVTFKGEIQVIGLGAFDECSSLTDFVIPDTVTYIGSKAFENAGCIENIDGVHYVQDWAVGSDEDIEEAIVKDGTIGIAEMTFFMREEVKIFDVPESVKYVGDLCFVGGSLGVPSVIHYRNNVIGERTLAASKTATDIYIYDADCDIFDSEKAIPANYKYSAIEKDDDFHFDFTFTSAEDRYVTGDIVIHGYADSTAQAYAEKYNRQFELIEEILPSGDINGDGELTIADVVVLQQWLLGESNEELKNWEEADLCKDGVLNVYDLCLMRKALIEKQGVGTTVTTFGMSSSKTGVDDFIADFSSYKCRDDDDEFYNITPTEITDKYGFRIFKCDDCRESYLEYKGNVYQLGSGFGDLGTISFAAADLNHDGYYELYFTFVWGSGQSISVIGYFDTAKSEVLELADYKHGRYMTFDVKDGKLEVCEAELDGTLNVDISTKPKDKLGEIVAEGGKIVFKPVESSDFHTYIEIE